MKTLKRNQFDVVLPPPPPGGGTLPPPPPPNAPKPKGVQQIPPQDGSKSDSMGDDAENNAPRIIDTSKSQGPGDDQDQKGQGQGEKGEGQEKGEGKGQGKGQGQGQEKGEGGGKGQGKGQGQEKGEGKGQGQGEGEGEGKGGQGEGEGKGQGKGGDDGKGKGGSVGPIYAKAGKVENVRNRGIGGMLSDQESRQMQKDLGVPEIGAPSEEEIKQTLRENFPLLNKGSRSAGSGKGSRTRLLPDAIAKIVKPLVDWKAALKKYIGRILGDQREAVMPNRRFVSSGDFVYGSRRMKNKLKTCVVAVDVSGSIGFKELVVMINEVKGIAMQNRINDFEIVYFDHGIQHVEKLSGKEVVSYKPTAVGGGGTSFKEPLEYMNQINKKGDLDLAVFITDGYADLNLPVPNFKNKFIWVIIDHASFEAPFGSKIVHITVKEGK